MKTCRCGGTMRLIKSITQGNYYLCNNGCGGVSFPSPSDILDDDIEHVADRGRD